MELLSRIIRNDKTITGIKIKNVEIKQSLFADDATYFNDGSKSSVERLIHTINEISKISGLNLTTTQSFFLKVVTLKKKLKFAENEPFIWTSECAKTLGITFHTDIKRNNELNLAPKIKDFKKCLRQWQHRKLTLMGRITVVKTYALPKLVYPFSVLPNTFESLIKDISKIIFNLNGKTNQIK